MMHTSQVILALIGFMVPSVGTFVQSAAKNVTSADTTVTSPNDLVDGDLLISPITVKQKIAARKNSSETSEFTSAAIQIAVDSAAQRGGGTVQLKAGTYTISAPIRLASNVALVGVGDSTVLRKIDGYRSQLSVDGDYGMLKVTVRDASGFRPGMGVQLSDSQYPSDYDVTVATILDIERNTIFLDQPTLRDYDCRHKAVLSNACSIVEAVGVENARIAQLVADGNKETNDLLGGCRGGAIYLQRALNCVVEDVKAKNFNGDVFSWQTTKNITIRDCKASHSTGKGFHPGTGSENTLVEGCSSHDNLDGVFLCWRVKKSTFRNNKLFNNKRDGISVNKKDTDNIFTNNHVYQNGRNGVWFNDYGEANNSHRNMFVSNIVEDNGTTGPGYGFFINSSVKDITVQNNTIRDTGNKTQKCGVLISKGALNIQVRNNTMAGHSDGDIVRK
jgi:parallel beta-helix repeat protein